MGSINRPAGLPAIPSEHQKDRLTAAHPARINRLEHLPVSMLEKIMAHQKMEIQLQDPVAELEVRLVLRVLG